MWLHHSLFLSTEPPEKAFVMRFLLLIFVPGTRLPDGLPPKRVGRPFLFFYNGLGSKNTLTFVPKTRYNWNANIQNF